MRLIFYDFVFVIAFDFPYCLNCSRFFQLLFFNLIQYFYNGGIPRQNSVPHSCHRNFLLLSNNSDVHAILLIELMVIFQNPKPVVRFCFQENSISGSYFWIDK